MSQSNVFKADLHCHSTFSDGTLTTDEIIRLAKSTGLSGLSITDHDSIMAYPQIFEEAKKLGLLMIPGVEFSSMHQGVSVHILAYSFGLNCESIHKLCQKHTERRQERNLMILQKLAEQGLPILESELKSLHVIGRPHIAQAMVEKGYVDSISEAFKKYIGDNKVCFAKGNPISVEVTLDAIHQAKGLAVLAHPHLAKDRSFVQKLLQFPFDGIECYYAKFSKCDHQIWLDIAAKKNLLITGGSDFHGDVKPATRLGSSWVNQEIFTFLLQHYELQNAHS